MSNRPRSRTKFAWAPRSRPPWCLTAQATIAAGEAITATPPLPQGSGFLRRDFRCLGVRHPVHCALPAGGGLTRRMPSLQPINLGPSRSVSTAFREHPKPACALMTPALPGHLSADRPGGQCRHTVAKNRNLPNCTTAPGMEPIRADTAISAISGPLSSPQVAISWNFLSNWAYLWEVSMNHGREI